jgi:5-methylcytosine-specific restriction endonuclease McrA
MRRKKTSLPLTKQAAARKSLKRTNFPRWKSSGLRSAWLARCKKVGLDVSQVPNTKQIEQWLIDNAPYTCYYTSIALNTQFEVDHKTPVSRGGTFGFDNLVIASPAMNGAKGSMTSQEFKQLLKLINKWPDQGKQLLIRLRRAHF